MIVNNVYKEVTADVTLTECDVRDLMSCITLARKRIDDGTTVATREEIGRYDELFVKFDRLLEQMES